jgi:hypothetical protein
MNFLHSLIRRWRCFRRTGGVHLLSVRTGRCGICGRLWSDLYPEYKSRSQRNQPQQHHKDSSESGESDKSHHPPGPQTVFV